jgi:hypothetical protein
MNYTYIYEYVPVAIEHSKTFAEYCFNSIIRFVLFIIVIIIKSESPEVMVRSLILILSLVYYCVEYMRGASVWGIGHIRRVLHYPQQGTEYPPNSLEYYVFEETERFDSRVRPIINSATLTLPIYFSSKHLQLLKIAKEDVDCPICCNKMDDNTFRILRKCCHTCCKLCLEQLTELKCPHCKTNL